MAAGLSLPASATDGGDLVQFHPAPIEACTRTIGPAMHEALTKHRTRRNVARLSGSTTAGTRALYWQAVGGHRGWLVLVYAVYCVRCPVYGALCTVYCVLYTLRGTLHAVLCVLLAGQGISSSQSRRVEGRASSACTFSTSVWPKTAYLDRCQVVVVYTSPTRYRSRQHIDFFPLHIIFSTSKQPSTTREPHVCR